MLSNPYPHTYTQPQPTLLYALSCIRQRTHTHVTLYPTSPPTHTLNPLNPHSLATPPPLPSNTPPRLIHSAKYVSSRNPNSLHATTIIFARTAFIPNSRSSHTWCACSVRTRFLPRVLVSGLLREVWGPGVVSSMGVSARRDVRRGRVEGRGVVSRVGGAGDAGLG